MLKLFLSEVIRVTEIEIEVWWRVDVMAILNKTGHGGERNGVDCGKVAAIGTDVQYYDASFFLVVTFCTDRLNTVSSNKDVMKI